MRPTFAKEAPVSENETMEIEVHIVNFQENLYGHDLEVQFLFKIRNEMSFETAEELKAQIKKMKRPSSKVMIAGKICVQAVLRAPFLSPLRGLLYYRIYQGLHPWLTYFRAFFPVCSRQEGGSIGSRQGK